MATCRCLYLFLEGGRAQQVATANSKYTTYATSKMGRDYNHPLTCAKLAARQQIAKLTERGNHILFEKVMRAVNERGLWKDLCGELMCWGPITHAPGGMPFVVSRSDKIIIMP